MDKKLEDYLNEDDRQTKSELYKDLINENTKDLTRELGTVNLLNLAFEPIDITEKTMQTLETIDEFDKNFNANVMQTINKGERKKTTKWFITGIAAILALSFVLMIINSSQNNLTSSTGINGQNTSEIKEVILLPEGVRATVYKNSEFEVLNEEMAYLKLKAGKLIVEVDSRKGKTPLFFHMPHGTVKVTGTALNLRCNTKESLVDVVEGEIEFIRNDETITVKTGETGKSSPLGLTKSVTQSPLMREGALLYSFNDLSQFKTSGNPKLVKGYIGSGIRLDGGSSIILEKKESSPSETFSLWFKPEEHGQHHRPIICQHDEDDPLSGFNIYSSKQKLILQLKDHERITKAESSRIQLNRWHHLAFSFNSNGEFKFYLNGERISEGNFPLTYRPSKLIIGKCQYGHWSTFIGTVDELTIFPKTLSEAEVLKIFKER